MELEKTLRMNTLFSFYEKLLTPKQAKYISDYYEEDYTLAEIADNHGVSRQAIYDSIKRTEDLLIEYEEKLQLIKEFDRRNEAIDNLNEYLDNHYSEDAKLRTLVNDIIQDSIREEN